MIRTGTRVTWSWGAGTGSGTVTEVHHETVTRTIKGEEITRHGSDDEPAYVIDSDSGDAVVKLAGEVERAD
ncbi:DUF2945 domain-containing protein [Nocardioides bruguierae]|uniref:DUF2945 domain-containing protein n=1 Tax=Nocardioides bruguierae TaxID=2945102 RepID=A0A9X2D710_9ACTN|nr:DUF2945 domain-containing protein [Nocardioides bruguierae]MCL8024034.1 DUF2945 domain-containing protein [Nocardioides bruguierae]MCM0620300.1 DUF2945 domain-containing protein [Nocardioides bruguierae]